MRLSAYTPKSVWPTNGSRSSVRFTSYAVRRGLAGLTDNAIGSTFSTTVDATASHTYRFYSTASDKVGFTESKAAAAEATTTITVGGG